MSRPIALQVQTYKQKFVKPAMAAYGFPVRQSQPYEKQFEP
jgi:hypothetical protein